MMRMEPSPARREARNKVVEVTGRENVGSIAWRTPPEVRSGLGQKYFEMNPRNKCLKLRFKSMHINNKGQVIRAEENGG